MLQGLSQEVWSPLLHCRRDGSSFNNIVNLSAWTLIKYLAVLKGPFLTAKFASLRIAVGWTCWTLAISNVLRGDVLWFLPY